MTNIDGGAFDQAEYDRRFHGDFMYDATIEDDEGGGGRSPLFIILTALVLMAFAAVVWVAYQQGVNQGGDKNAPPVITAEAGPVKIAPENPGGVTVPDQDKQIYERMSAAEESAQPVPEGALAAPPEEPVDLPAAPAPAAMTAAPSASEIEDPGAAEAGDAAIADSDPATAPASAAQVEAEAAAKEQAAALTEEIEKIDPGVAKAAAAQPDVAAGAFVVQLGSFKSDSEAASMWQTVKTKNTDQLGSFKPDIKRVDLGAKGIWYRLRVGPFETRADAVALAEVLKTRGLQPIVQKP